MRYKLMESSVYLSINCFLKMLLIWKYLICLSFFQAAKEFESELKKEPDSAIEAPTEKPASLSEEEKQDIKVSSSKENI